jgi:Protein of unknown function (DUF4013)
LQQDASGGLTSADGRWRWDGQAWVPNPAGRWPAVPVGFGDVFSIPTWDHDWLGKCGIEGLIALIPIYGSFEILGWTLTYLDNLRAGRAELPPARFGYAGRGAAPAVVALVWGLAIAAVVFGAIGVSMASLAATAQQCPASGSCGTSATSPLLGLFSLGFAGLPALFLLVVAVEYFLALPVILRSERLGIEAGLNLLAAARLARNDLTTSAVGAVLVFLIAFIAGLGAYACFIGVVFSYGYGAAMLGVALRWYEQRVAVVPGT